MKCLILVCTLMVIAAAKQMTTESKVPTTVDAKPTASLATAAATPHAVSYFEQGVHHNNGGHHYPTHHASGHGSNAAYWEHFNNHVVGSGHGAHNVHGAHGYGHFDNHQVGHAWPYGQHLSAPHSDHAFHASAHRHSRSGYQIRSPNFIQWDHRY